MIPSKLRLRNFMCYREVPALLFEGIHTVCLSGDNGSGKSALIDAMTWALWGKARTGSDDELVYASEREMEVEFDFRIGEQLYRVVRKHAKPKKSTGSGKSELDFQIASGEGFRSIAGDLINQTEKKIISTLHMDYDTFINSAYLRQGHADQFTEQPPSKRKEVLVNILGLSLYDDLSDRARELEKQREQERAQLEQSIGEIDAELVSKPTYEAEKARAESEVSRTEQSVKTLESHLNDLRLQKEALDKKAVQLEQVQVNILDKEKRLNDLAGELDQHIAKVKIYEELISQRTDIEDGYLRFTDARLTCESLNQKLSALIKLNERKSALMQKIEQEKSRLDQGIAIARHQIAELDQQVRRIFQFSSEQASHQAALEKLAEQEQSVKQKRQLLQDIRADIASMLSSAERLKVEIKEIDEKLHLLHNHSEAKCPLCESDLSGGGVKRVEDKYAAQRSEKESLLTSVSQNILLKSKEFEALKKDLPVLEARVQKEKSFYEKALAVLEKDKREAEHAREELASTTTQMESLERQVSAGEFAIDEQVKVKEIIAEISRLEYDGDKHDTLREQLSTLLPYESRKRQLEKADTLIATEKELAAKATELSQQIRISLDTDNQKQTELLEELRQLPALVNTIAQSTLEHKTSLDQLRCAQEALWNVNAKLQRCAELEIRRKEKRALLAQSANEESIYHSLAEAFGKRGIQALLIENMALPEIENEANRLLSRMTDNRMHIKFETRRPTKKGDTVETLDINITDELGTRNYEMFSGGEAFRINFAMRIALSRLLAHRRNAPLPTLIIDEGFGTQDAGGIEKLKEAITSIQDDFELIIVITHIEELRDAFPTRIDVVKGADGSMVNIS